MTAKNTHRMPFLLETEDAVDRIGRAILRGDRTLTFPWQVATAMRVLRQLPDGISDRASGRLR